MIELTMTQKDLRSLWGVGFCCVCGKPFAHGEERTRQHIPPTSVFAKEDREPPLILPAHDGCNQGQSTDDEVIGQLVSLLHGKRPAKERLRLAVQLFSVNGSVVPMAFVRDLPLNRIIFRWVRGFHAALYREYLPDRGGFIGPPFPESKPVEGGKVAPEPIHESRYDMTLTFKQQVKAGRTDAVTCRNGKCHYRCTWLNLDNGAPFCLFALRLYNWEELGDVHHFPRRGCIGWYGAPIPATAARGTRLEIPASNFDPLDPFAP